MEGHRRRHHHQSPTRPRHPPPDQNADRPLADKHEKDVIAWRHDIHQNPELSNREFRTSNLIADHLRALKFDEVHINVAPTGVVGVLRGGTPGDRVVALRADIDALPVAETADVAFKSTRVDEDYPGGPFPVAHACGHDTHTAMLMGAASVLAEMRDDIPGTVMFIFQPAEEGPPLGEEFGADAMVKAGVFQNLKPGAVFGMHVAFFPVNHIGYAIGVQNGASEVITIDIEGKQTHGSMPFMGLDPLPVLAAINDGFAQIYRQIDTNTAMTISIGKIDTVGRSNIIGQRIVATGTVRAISDAVMDDINMRLQRVVENAARMHGLTATLKIDQHVPAVVNQPEWLERFVPTAERVAGKDKVFKMEPTMGYDDVSVFMNAVGGGIYFILGGQHTRFDENGNLVAAEEGGPGPVPNHNPGFYADDAVLKTGVRLHAYSALDYLTGT
ncbi:amidohydrolase [Mycobacterium sp. Y57]|nr:amidohydrolase [Mycolicibacterium xanthum]